MKNNNEGVGLETKSLDEHYVAGSYGRFPVELCKGKGSIAYGKDGKEYVDLCSGIAVNTFGFCDDEYNKAVVDQLYMLQHVSNLYYTEPYTKLAKGLCEKSGMKKVFFGNSGAEANEGAIKAARRYSSIKYNNDRNKIVTLNGSFHGRTITTLSATGQEEYHVDFTPFTDGFVYCKPNDVNELKKILSENECCAIMIETIQGEGGINVLTKEFVKACRDICDEKDLIFIVDEVQTGNGRTGKYFSYQHYDVLPDVVSTAKGLGGGLPIGAVLLGEKVKDIFPPGTHGSTFGGNPVCCAGALNILSRLTDEFMIEVEKKSQYIIDMLKETKGIKGIYGKGLMLGIETERPAGEIVKACLNRGVLVLTAKTKVRLLPPLNISYAELDKAINILREEIEQQ